MLTLIIMYFPCDSKMYTLTADVDYESKTDYQLILDQGNNLKDYTFNIRIFDDEDQNFTMSLSLPDGPTDDQRVLLKPRDATVVVIDAIGRGKNVFQLCIHIDSTWHCSFEI